QQEQGLADRTRNLSQDLQNIGNATQNRDAANRARAAANQAGRIPERMENASDFLDAGQYPYAVQNQRAVQQQLNDLEQQIGQAANAAGNNDQRRLQNALNQVGEINQNLESLRRRVQDQQGQQGQGQRQGQQPGQGRGQQQSQQQGQG